jgi:hypothetical protein
LDWTAKADAKAAFAFGIDSAIIATVGVLVSTGRVFVHFQAWYLIVTVALGSALLAGAILCAAAGVAPRLRRGATRRHWRDNFIYFGHARHWSPQRMEQELTRGTLLRQLSRQIVVTADVAWKKHILVNWAIWLTVGAGSMFVGYALLTRIPSVPAP